ncbi:hypothetical protein M0R72_09480 [Candidatus Pacearchaeota archaeon]|nr:hypothetical protein [Candidatus Pacearchaeota archaeon]
MDWLSIVTAPRDGTVVLTDEGTARYVSRDHWASPVTEGWYLSDTSGNIPSCADNGMGVSSIEPTLWMSLPVQRPDEILDEDQEALTKLSVKELYAKDHKIMAEIVQRRLEFLHRMASQSSLSAQQVQSYVDKGRSAFPLPMADWAAVTLGIKEDRITLAKDGGVAFYPIIAPTKETETDEYLELFKPEVRSRKV